MRSHAPGLGILTVSVLCSVSSSGADQFDATRWVVARSANFEVYSDAGPDRAKLTLAQFEELRSFFDLNHIVQPVAASHDKPPVSVIEFSSKKEYEPFKVRPTADAYFNGTPDRDYIVMPISATDDFSIAAHEYAHFVLHSAALKLPAWLSEGLAEIFSTVSITKKRCEIGGALPARVETLRRHRWIPASDLFAAASNAPIRNNAAAAALFYAESWAITDMLTSSPEYAPHFGDLIETLRSANIGSQQALAKIYNASADAILIAAQDWIARNHSARQTLPALAPERFGIELHRVSEFEARATIADLLFTNGEWDRAARIYRQLLMQSPNNPEILASLGTIALRKGDRHAAVQYWCRALDHGLRDATLCYRYAVLADQINLPSEEIEHALERAISIKPDFDDARYKLAFLYSNAGKYAAAVEQFESMARPGAARAFNYWTALAYALSELGRRDEAESAAKQALRFAVSSEDRARAAELAYVAKTDLAVRFARGADGQLQLVTTRVPHGTPEFNPFIEPGDQIQVLTGTLREVQCDAGKLTGFLVESKNGVVNLSVPDPLHVLMRNGPSEFYCGPQTARDVKVEYATAAKADTGVLRSMDFRP